MTNFGLKWRSIFDALTPMILTHSFQLNGTHVEYRNKLVAGSDAEVLEKGAVIVGSQNSPSRKALAAKLKCLFPVELMVSTAFLPNISHVTIPAWFYLFR